MLKRLKILYRRWYAWRNNLIYIGDAYWDGNNTPRIIDMTSDGSGRDFIEGTGKWQYAKKPALTRKYWNRLLDKIEGTNLRSK